MFVIHPRGLDTSACGDIGRSRYTTHVVLNLILLISRDAIHLVVVGTLIGMLPSYRLMIRNQLVYAGNIFALRMSPRVIYQRVCKYATSSCTSFGNNVVFI